MVRYVKWIEIFKLYNTKKIKKEKVLYIFTIISILIAVSISLIIPQVNLENEKYIESNIEIINGGDLNINVAENPQKEFDEKLIALKNEGVKVETSNIINCYYKKDSNKIIGNVVIGDYSLNDDEIILQRTLAKILNIKVGDPVKFDTQGNGVFEYKVKNIEEVSSGVDRDTELLGYGKVQSNSNLDKILGKKVININGKDGEKLKSDLLEIDDSNIYTTIQDKRNEMKSEISVQKTTLGILSTVSYIFSSLTIISFVVMIILKRKKDIAILKVISIDTKDIKKSLLLEMLFLILVPIIMSAFLSYYGSNLILRWCGVIVSGINIERINLILKGMFFNVVVFFILVNIAMSILEGISSMCVLREDEKYIKKQSKKIGITTIITIPLLLVIYSIYFNSVENLGSSILVVLVILIFLGIISLMIKILSRIKFRNSIIMYSVKSIKNRFFSFVLIVMSLTLTLCVILIGFNLENSIKCNFQSSLEESLPYDYYIESKDYDNIEKILKDYNIDGYIKASSISGKVKNNNFNSMYKNLYISEIDKNDYKLKYNIIMGDNLFEGEEGVIISDEMREQNMLDIGDVLEIETSKGIIKEKIKGVYKSGGINTSSILKENVEFGDEVNYLVKSKSDDFIEKLNNSIVLSINDVGEKFAMDMGRFLKMFRILSVICIFGTVLFNINMVCMNCNKDEKDEEMLITLGFGKLSIIKVQAIKILLLICFSSTLSIGIYSIGINMFFKLLINSSGKVSLNIIVLNIIISIIIAFISFILPIRKIVKKKELTLLREEY